MTQRRCPARRRHLVQTVQDGQDAARSHEPIRQTEPVRVVGGQIRVVLAKSADQVILDVLDGRIPGVQRHQHGDGFTRFRILQQTEGQQQRETALARTGFTQDDELPVWKVSEYDHDRARRARPRRHARQPSHGRKPAAA